MERQKDMLPHTTTNWIKEKHVILSCHPCCPSGQYQRSRGLGSVVGFDDVVVGIVGVIDIDHLVTGVNHEICAYLI